MSRRAALLAAALSLAGCSTDRVVLLPDAQGHVGKIMVTHSGKETLLDQAYSSAEVSGLGVDKAVLDKEAVQREFQPELQQLPPRPVSYMLYFLGDSDELTPESKEQAPAILADIARRPAAEVVVIGHTDSMGERKYNDGLSLSRARAIRAQLLALGFDQAHLRFAGRGEREPLVPTGDETPEPRNRRVEINVR